MSLPRPILLAEDRELRPPLLLAPMEGVTDPSFRALVAAANPGALGAVSTEFLRVTAPPLPLATLRRELGPAIPGVLRGLQLMGNRPDMVAATAARAGEAGADFLDLNFGCPAPRVFQHRAGAALLEDPPALESLLRAVVEACPLPVTAKIRAGGEDDRRLEEIAARVEAAGAVALTVHARLRVESYRAPADWSRIRRAVTAVTIPVIGNGSADSPRAIERMFAETGCAGVMVGRGALGDPWVFRRWRALREGREDVPPSPADRLAWLNRYRERMEAGGATPLQAAGRLKQALKAAWTSGALPDPPADRRRGILRERDPGVLLSRLGAETPARTRY